MKRILFCWQLGANYGHLGQDLPVAEALRQRGMEICFAVPDLRLAAERIAPSGFPYVMAPLALGVPTPPFSLASFAEILLISGFADELTLTGVVEAWRRILDLTRADAVVLDYAPMALLAARLAKIPALQLSTGFDVPPAVTPLPAMLPPEAVPASRLAAAEELVAKRISTVLMGENEDRCSTLQELLASVPTLFTNFPELDHYGAREGGNYVGPVFGDIPGTAVPWPEGARRRVFAYLRSSTPGVYALLDALASSGQGVVCAMPGAPRALANRYESNSFRLLPHAIPLAPLLTSADLAITYGGVGTTAAALLAGVPLLIAPESLEQQLVGERVRALGSGQMVLGARSQADFTRVLEQVLGDAAYRKAACAFAQKHAGYRVDQAIDRIVTTIDELLRAKVKTHPMQTSSVSKSQRP